MGFRFASIFQNADVTKVHLQSLSVYKKLSLARKNIYIPIG